MNAKEKILFEISNLKAEIQSKYRVKEIGVFGAVARGEQGGASDIDVLVDFQEGASLFDLVGLALFLEERLGRKVDVVSKSALREELREAVLREVAIL